MWLVSSVAPSVSSEQDDPGAFCSHLTLHLSCVFLSPFVTFESMRKGVDVILRTEG